MEKYIGSAAIGVIIVIVAHGIGIENFSMEWWVFLISGALAYKCQAHKK